MNIHKRLRADNTFLIEGKYGDNPKLMGRLRSDARITLYLEYYHGKTTATSCRSNKVYSKNIRHNERLRLYLFHRPKTAVQRQHNRQTLQIARKLRHDRDCRMSEETCGYSLPHSTATDIMQWMLDYHDAYTKSDRRHIMRACRIFREFLESTPLMPHFTGKLHDRQLTPAVIAAFTDYLRSRFRGEGPHTLYARFKKIMKAATAAGVLRANPCDGISIKTDANVIRKDVLGHDEIILLASTHYAGENPEVRRGFIFCLYAGLRWCDITRLTYQNVDFSNRLLRFEQAKTRGHSSSSSVVIPLSPMLLSLIGSPGTKDRDSHVFPLPSRRVAQTALRRWTAAAGIDKHITWHCARHSFALNLLNHGANIKTVASLLGHSTIRHTEKYTRAVDSLKRDAILSLSTPTHP